MRLWFVAALIGMSPGATTFAALSKSPWPVPISRHLQAYESGPSQLGSTGFLRSRGFKGILKETTESRAESEIELMQHLGIFQPEVAERVARILPVIERFLINEDTWKVLPPDGGQAHPIALDLANLYLKLALERRDAGGKDVDLPELSVFSIKDGDSLNARLDLGQIKGESVESFTQMIASLYVEARLIRRELNELGIGDESEIQLIGMRDALETRLETALKVLGRYQAVKHYRGFSDIEDFADPILGELTNQASRVLEDVRYKFRDSESSESSENW